MSATMSSLEFLPLGTDSLTHSLQARLPQIQLVLDLPQHVVVDAALLAQADGGLALGAQELERHLAQPAAIARRRAALFRVIRAQTGETAAIMFGEVLVQGS